MQSEHDKRQFIIEELISTERTYIKNIRIVIDVFEKPLRSKEKSRKKILEKFEIDKLFGIINSILHVNERLVKDLTTAKISDSVGKCMRDFIPFLKVYIPYFEHFTDNAKMSSKLEKERESFSLFLAEQLLDPVCCGMHLNSFLIMPIQRLPRYTLLLAELSKVTSDLNPDYLPLLVAIDTMKEVTSMCNKAIEVKEDNLILLDLSSRIKGMNDLVQPNRRLVKEGSLKKLNSGGFKEYYFFLFSDILVYCKGKGSRDTDGRYKIYNLHNTLSLVSLEAKKVESSDNIIEIEAKEKSFLIQAATANELKSWFDCLIEACRKVKTTIKGEYVSSPKASFKNNLTTLRRTSANTDFDDLDDEVLTPPISPPISPHPITPPARTSSKQSNLPWSPKAPPPSNSSVKPSLPSAPRPTVISNSRPAIPSAARPLSDEIKTIVQLFTDMKSNDRNKVLELLQKIVNDEKESVKKQDSNKNLLTVVTITSPRRDSSSKSLLGEESHHHERDQPFDLKIFLSDIKMEQYYDIFLNEGFNHLSLFKKTTEIELMKIGITKKNHLKILLSQIANYDGLPDVPELPLSNKLSRDSSFNSKIVKHSSIRSESFSSFKPCTVSSCNRLKLRGKMYCDVHTKMYS